MSVINLQVRKKGNITLPVELRSKYGVSEGDILTLIDLGDGSFLLTPRVSEVNRLGKRVAEALSQYDVSEDDLIAALDQEREEYYREHYAGKPSPDEKA
ncbi:regulators of stationary/sporulation gene expression [Longilinea arvoryzae]|uniref:Regulators of stationary/sporulation gene expression n=1 Tax=Longilinea arvoryzae TaxID=360412 RepID=A0A0S7BGR0_9CHLR|nr:AbrB/MazE/SpoVT family DNA-binding domain-containing protein [Longilinea arvoryzae]GAP13368.1 regulators of stationary/sporulation gene expression [Longilinea arvoryzae]